MIDYNGIVCIGGNNNGITFLYKDRRIFVYITDKASRNDTLNKIREIKRPYFVNGFIGSWISNTLNPTIKAE